jgi:hypothetical protein
MVRIHIVLFWVTAPYSFVDGCHHFWRTHCLRGCHDTTILHDVMLQKIAIKILIMQFSPTSPDLKHSSITTWIFQIEAYNFLQLQVFVLSLSCLIKRQVKLRFRHSPYVRLICNYYIINSATSPAVIYWYLRFVPETIILLILWTLRPIST